LAAIIQADYAKTGALIKSLNLKECRLMDGFHILPDGHRLYWRLDDFTDPWTSAPTVLLIHGFAESGETWRAWVPHLARDYRVLRIDRRGFGKSDPMPADFAWSLDRMV